MVHARLPPNMLLLGHPWHGSVDVAHGLPELTNLHTSLQFHSRDGVNPIRLVYAPPTLRRIVARHFPDIVLSP